MRAIPILLVCSAVLSSCASQSPEGLVAGADMAAVTARLGHPTNTYARPDGGTRLEFARGPAGIGTYMVDLDASGKVISWQQVLTEANFDQVAAGEPENQLRFSLGRPSDVRSGDRQGGQVWSYRYSPYGQCEWFQVSLSDAQAVTSAGYALDPRCDANTGGR